MFTSPQSAAKVQRLPANVDATYYRFEDNIASHFFSINPNRRSMSNHQAQCFAAEVLMDLSPEHRPQFTTVTGRTAFADYENMLLKMPEWSWNMWVIVHEIAHFQRISQPDYHGLEGGHSSAFALTHFRLACKWIPHTHGPNLLLEIWKMAIRFRILMDHPDTGKDY